MIFSFSLGAWHPVVRPEPEPARRTMPRTAWCAGLIALATAAPLAPGRAQGPRPNARDAASASVDSARSSTALDSLVALAIAVNPTIHAAAARAKAAQLRVGPAGARPDPMLMAGIQNFPIAKPGFSDFMTMKMVGVSQTFPYPGKLSLETRAAVDEVTASRAAIDAARLDVTARVKDAYYDLAFADRALDIVRRNQTVLTNLAAVSLAQYSTGSGTQADVLRARTETANLGDAASDLAEKRRAALAQLNALLDRPTNTFIDAPSIPARIVKAAVADSASEVHFASDALGARAADSPMLPLDSLQALAVANNPILQEHIAQIAAQRSRIEIARKAHLPDISVSLEYGQRQGFTDMVTAIISIPVPLQKGRKQDADVAASEAELAMLEAQHHEMVNALDADIATELSDVERARTELALAKRAILPQAQATLASAMASYQVGRLDFAAVMDAQAGVFNTETAYYHSLTEFAKHLAELERTVGTGVLR